MEKDINKKPDIEFDKTAYNNWKQYTTIWLSNELKHFCAYLLYKYTNSEDFERSLAMGIDSLDVIIDTYEDNDMNYFQELGIKSIQIKGRDFDITHTKSYHIELNVNILEFNFKDYIGKVEKYNKDFESKFNQEENLEYEAYKYSTIITMKLNIDREEYDSLSYINYSMHEMLYTCIHSLTIDKQELFKKVINAPKAIFLDLDRYKKYDLAQIFKTDCFKNKVLRVCMSTFSEFTAFIDSAYITHDTCIYVFIQYVGQINNFIDVFYNSRYHVNYKSTDSKLYVYFINNTDVKFEFNNLQNRLDYLNEITKRYDILFSCEE